MRQTMRHCLLKIVIVAHFFFISQLIRIELILNEITDMNGETSKKRNIYKIFKIKKKHFQIRKASESLSCYSLLRSSFLPMTLSSSKVSIKSEAVASIDKIRISRIDKTITSRIDKIRNSRKRENSTDENTSRYL